MVEAASTDDVSRPGATLDLTDEALGLPRSVTAGLTYDVLLNDQHVWSLQPERDATEKGDRLVAAWPKALRPHLKGLADVAVRDHLTGEVLAEGSHAFGGRRNRRVKVADEEGRLLVLDKYDRLIKPMSGQSPELLEELLDATVRVLKTLQDSVGVPAFVCYGTLLGAVRSGQVIGHDNDIDVAYLSPHRSPVDVIRESYRIERVLRQHNMVVRRGSGARLNVKFQVSDGSIRCVDIFTACIVEDVLYMQSDTGFRLPEATILPLGSVTLHGREVPAPAQPERLLAETYGAGWRTPDPSFKYQTPSWLTRRLSGWFGGLSTHRKHWDGFHTKLRSRLPSEPTDFARWVAETYPSSRPLVELGSGTGRDALWFARRHQREVTGLDYSMGAVNRSKRASRQGKLAADFRVFNLYDTRQVLALGAELSRGPSAVDLYARFLLHALEPQGQVNLIRLASMSLRRGGLLFLEFRTPRDRGRPHLFGDHQRHYLRPRAVAAMIRRSGGRVVHRQTGIGLAILDDEDPHVCRMVATWSDLAPRPRPEAVGPQR